MDDKNQYELSNLESESFIMATQFITDGAFESALLNGSQVSLIYSLDKKKSEIKNVKVCFGNCDEQNLTIEFSNIKK